MSRTSPLRTTRGALIALVLIPGLLLSGCGYSVRPPYDRTIQTVFVQFKSVSFRKDMNLELNELVIKEIQTRTPYTVVGDPDQADAKLMGTITYADKSVAVENPNNLPRHLLGTIVATVVFSDNRTGAQATRTIPAAIVGEMAPFYPEIGETSQLGFQKVMAKMAKDIVSMMEKPWGPEYREDIDRPPYDPDTTPIDAPRGRRARRDLQRQQQQLKALTPGAPNP